MHIPDGYLSLQTSLPAIGAMVPVWSLAAKRVKKVLNRKQIPLLSLCAAFSFVIMMFNIPLGASSVHAVGAVFIAILLGPWAACISVSTALIIQAVLFGDGGILAIGANCFNMAFAMPFAGYYLYRIISGKAQLTSKRSVIGVFAGGYVGINVAALLTAIEFGIQPLLFKTAGGLPLYGFYPLSVSVPAMMSEHLLVAGPVEGLVTVSAITYLVKFSPQLFADNVQASTSGGIFKTYKIFFIGIIALIILTPLGLLATGTAWGEWGTSEVRNILGYVPSGFERFSDFWKTAIPDYSVPGLDGGFFKSSLGYIVCAVLGVILISVIMAVSSRFIIKNHNKDRG